MPLTEDICVVEQARDAMATMAVDLKKAKRTIDKLLTAAPAGSEVFKCLTRLSDYITYATGSAQYAEWHLTNHGWGENQEET
jgi:hypothetical protein